MYPFGYQDTSFEGERYYNTNYYAPSWNGNQYQYGDQYYYNEGYHYEGYQHNNFDPQEYHAMPQDTTHSSDMKIMLYNFLQEREKFDKELQARLERMNLSLAATEPIIREQPPYTNEVIDLAKMREEISESQSKLQAMLDSLNQTGTAKEEIMNERVEMEITSHQDTRVYEAEIFSPLISMAVGGELDTSMPSELGVETEEYVDSKEESCEDFVDVHPCEIKENPQENSDVTVEDECEVWKPSFPTVEYTRCSLVGAEYEDVYLTTPPPDKFQQFFPYILELLNERSHDPFVLEEAYILKGSRPYYHFILHGRRFKWDLKVD